MCMRCTSQYVRATTLYELRDRAGSCYTQKRHIYTETQRAASRARGSRIGASPPTARLFYVSDMPATPDGSSPEPPPSAPPAPDPPPP